MRYFSLAVLVVVAGARAGVAQPAVPVAQARPQLSLADAVAAALDHSPAVVAARSGIEQADLSLRLAKSVFNFKVTPNIFGSFGEASLSNQTYGVNVAQRLASGALVSGDVMATSYRNQLGTYYNTDTTLQVMQPLLRAAGASVFKRPLFDAESRVSDAGRQLALIEQQTALEVATAYYAIVVQARLVDVAKSALDRATNLRDASRARLATGRVSQLDTLRAEQLAGQAEAQLLDAQGAYADAHDRLAILVDRRVTDEFAVIDEIPVDVPPLDVDRAVELAIGHRPELQTAQNALAASERAVLAARSQLRPQVDLGVAVTRQQTVGQLGTAFGTNDFKVATLAAINAPVDRTAEAVALESALLERAQRQRDLDVLRDRVTVEARQGARRQAHAQRALSLAQAAVRSAEREVEVATSRFQIGLSNNLDVVSAQSSLRGAQGQEIAARAEVALASLAARAAVGVLDPRVDVK